MTPWNPGPLANQRRPHPLWDPRCFMHAWRSFVRSVTAPSHNAVSPGVGRDTFSDRLNALPSVSRESPHARRSSRMCRHSGGRILRNAQVKECVRAHQRSALGRLCSAERSLRTFLVMHVHVLLITAICAFSFFQMYGRKRSRKSGFAGLSRSWAGFAPFRKNEVLHELCTLVHNYQTYGFAVNRGCFYR